MADIHERVKQIRDGARSNNGPTNFAEALARVFEDPWIADDTGGPSPLASRLMNVLKASEDKFPPHMSHFSGIFAEWTDGDGGRRRGDTGFKRVFQDGEQWPGSSMQVGHFMTAVDMGFRPWELYSFVEGYRLIILGPRNPDVPARPNWWTVGELDCVKMMIAHEQVADTGSYGQEPRFWNKVHTFCQCDASRRG